MEGRKEDQTKIQQLSSEISELKSAITKLRTELSSTQKINQSLTKNNRLLSQSNDELRNSNGLMLRNEQKELQEKLTATQDILVSNKREAETREANLIADCNLKVRTANERANEIEKRCFRDNDEAAKARKAGEAFRDEHERILREQTEEIDKFAENKIATTIASLKQAKELEIKHIQSNCKSSIQKHKKYYASEYVAKEMWHVIIFIFCIVWLAIQAISSNYFRNEAVVFGNWIKTYMINSFDTVSLWATSSATISDGINHEIVANILYWAILIIVGLFSILLFYGVPVVVIMGGGFIYLRSNLFDKANRWVMIGSGIFFVAMSSEMFYTPKTNLLLLWLLVQVAIPLIRFVIIPLIGSFFDKWNSMDSDERRNVGCNIMMIITVIAGFLFLIWSMQSCSADLVKMSH